MTHPLSDYLTRIRNAAQTKHRIVEMPTSSLKERVSQILQEQGYIEKYERIEAEPQSTLRVYLKYQKGTKKPPFEKLKVVSTPGRRIYKKTKELKPILQGLGIAIVTTSKGILTDKEARDQKIGGEVLCHIY